MSEKTEQPSPKRLRDAREKGDVCKSQDVPSALTVLVLAIYLTVRGPDMLAELRDMVEGIFQAISQPFAAALPQSLTVAGRACLELILPPVALVMATALLANIAQVGFLAAFSKIVPSMENISPAQWFKKIFSVKNLVEFCKNILKVVVLGAVAYLVLERHFRTLFLLERGDMGTLWAALGLAARDLLLCSAAVFCLIAAADYCFQRWQYTRQHMMTKDEVKREYKEMEGDPQIKGKRKQLHREMINQGALEQVRKAKVLVTNPTHYAVALDYEKGRTPLPVVLARGEGELALRMMEAARQAGVPIMRNVPLARALYAEGMENAYIPTELIAPVAEVLRWVRDVRAQGGDAC